MAKAGRKLKPGKRYGNGRLTRKALAEDATTTVVEARMRQYGVSKQAATDPDMGFPLGRLLKRKYISQPQYAAGTKFAEVMRAYMGSKGLGSPTERAIDPDPDNRGQSLKEGRVWREGEARDMIEALAETDRQLPSRRTATSLVWDVCLREHSGQMDMSEMGRLREGLNAICRVIKRREMIARRAA